MFERMSYHCLDVWQVFEVFHCGQSIPTDYTVNLSLGAALGLGEEDHGHHPPCEYTKGSLASGTLEMVNWESGGRG